MGHLYKRALLNGPPACIRKFSVSVDRIVVWSASVPFFLDRCGCGVGALCLHWAFVMQPATCIAPTDRHRVRESVSERGAIKIALNATRERRARASAAAASKRDSTRLGVRNRRPFPSDCDTLIRHNSQLGESQADSQSAVSLTREVEHCSLSSLWERILWLLPFAIGVGL